MTNKEIKYELAECLATTDIVKERLDDTLDIISMETMKERLVLLLEYFKSKPDRDNSLNNHL